MVFQHLWDIGSISIVGWKKGARSDLDSFFRRVDGIRPRGKDEVETTSPVPSEDGHGGLAVGVGCTLDSSLNLTGSNHHSICVFSSVCHSMLGGICLVHSNRGAQDSITHAVVWKE